MKCEHTIWALWSISHHATKGDVHCSLLNIQTVQNGATSTQQDYYGRQCGTLLHSYCTGTYTEVTVLLLWGSSNATLEYPHRYFNRVAVWVLHGNNRVTSQEQHWYFRILLCKQSGVQGIDIEYNKRLDHRRPCLEDDLTAGSNL